MFNPPKLLTRNNFRTIRVKFYETNSTFFLGYCFVSFLHGLRRAMRRYRTILFGVSAVTMFSHTFVGFFFFRFDLRIFTVARSLASMGSPHATVKRNLSWDSPTRPGGVQPRIPISLNRQRAPSRGGTPIF